MKKYHCQQPTLDLFDLRSSLKSLQGIDNRWVKLGDSLPWAQIEVEYNKMKIDATCCPTEARFPTDINLLEGGSKLMERLLGKVWAKIGVSVVGGYTYIDHLSWDAYNECSDLPLQLGLFRERFGCDPDEILVDKIYLNRDNRKLLKKEKIPCHCSRWEGLRKPRIPSRSSSEDEPSSRGTRSSAASGPGKGSFTFNLYPSAKRL
ncbi:MAG: hypothetical protein LIP02_02080 [Bacteroidales bacterium]|nr:hypothetical protein [Bacteroidales bacterium]